MIIKNLNLSYGTNILYKDFSLDILDSEITCILGKSGCGKTSFLNVLCGNVKYSGVVENTEKIGYVFQTPRLINSISIKKNLELVLKNKDENKIDDLLKELEIYEIKNKYPGEISGGEASRVSIARALLFEPKILLLDEPFTGLDVVRKNNLIKKLNQMVLDRKIGLIYVTHDVDEALLIANRVLVLDERPVKIKLDLKIDGKERSLSSKEINEAREKIYSNLLS
jgi:NitT/TauT family transport system ATP-binding protein